MSGAADEGRHLAESQGDFPRDYFRGYSRRILATIFTLDIKARFNKIIAGGPKIVIGARDLVVDAVLPALRRRADKTDDLF